MGVYVRVSCRGEDRWTWDTLTYTSVPVGGRDVGVCVSTSVRVQTCEWCTLLCVYRGILPVVRRGRVDRSESGLRTLTDP